MEATRPDRAAVSTRRILVIAILCTAVGFLATGIERGFGQPEKKKKQPAANKGLAGILPEESPDSLVLEEFDPLGKEWAKWSEAVTKELMNLYSAEEPSAAKQRKAIAALRAHLKTADAAILGTSTPQVRNTLVQLRGGILRRIDLAEAALDTLEADPVAAKQQRMAQAWPRVASTLSRLESHIRSYQGGDAWFSYLRLPAVRAAVNDKNAAAPELALAAGRINGRRRLPAKDQVQFLSHERFSDFAAAVNSLLRAHNAPTQVNAAKLRAELKTLFAALEKHESTSSLQAATQVRTSYENLETVAPDGGATIAKAMRVHYFNYNLRVYVAEPFLNRFIAECRTERGTIRERVMEANVYGNQITTTNVAVDLRPSNDVARFNITLAGVTNSSTIGRTSQADIYTAGYHQFWATKEIRFDGNRFYPYQQARISVNAYNRTTGARTKISWLPLIGGIANRIAMNEANKRRPQTEAYARNKIAQQVSSEFNREVESNFVKANRDFQEKVIKPTEDAGLKPQAQAVRTTDELLLLSSRVMNDSELAGAASNLHEAPGWGVTVRLHESAMNNAFNRLDIAGRALTEDQLVEEIEKPIKKLLSERKKKPDAKPKKKSTDKFLFDSQDPIRFRIRKGQLIVILRTGLRRMGEEDIPTQVITIPLNVAVVKDKISIKRGIVGVAPAKPPQNRAKQIARAGIMRNKIQEAIEDRLVDGVFKLGRDGGKKTMRVTVTRINTNNGWVTVWAK